MFTGIIEEKGVIREISRGGRAGLLMVEASKVREGTSIGDSICVSGVCLTVVDLPSGGFTAEVMPETLRRSTLSGASPGTPVNLERALLLSDRLGGHMVNGHVDAIGTVRRRRPEENAVLFEIALPGELVRYVVPKGSVAVDGISLTVVHSESSGFTVSIIPRTLEETTLADARQGTTVNVEVDILAKYVEAMMGRASGKGGLEEALLDGGFMKPEQL